MSSPLPTSTHILPVKSILIIQSHSSQSFSSSSSSLSSSSSWSSWDRVQKRLTSLPACSCTCLLKLSHQDLYNFIIIIISVIINVILIIRLKFQEVWTLTARTSCHTDVDTPTTVFFPFSLIKQAPPKLLSKYPPTPKKPPSAPLDHCPQNRSSECHKEDEEGWRRSCSIWSKTKYGLLPKIGTPLCRLYSRCPKPGFFGPNRHLLGPWQLNGLVWTCPQDSFFSFYIDFWFLANL